jgi:cAMP-dependent protein kinase regulator
MHMQNDARSCLTMHHIFFFFYPSLLSLFVSIALFPPLSSYTSFPLELALLNDMPRAATIKAQGRLKCATLGKRAFVRLLGPVVEIIKRNSVNYQTIEEQIQQHQQQLVPVSSAPPSSNASPASTSPALASAPTPILSSASPIHAPAPPQVQLNHV